MIIPKATKNQKWSCSHAYTHSLNTWNMEGPSCFFFKLGCGLKIMQAPKNHQKLELWTIRQTYLPNFFSAMNLALGNQAVHRDGKGMFYYGLRQLNFLAGRTGSKGNTHSIMFTHILIVPIVKGKLASQSFAVSSVHFGTPMILKTS